MFTIAIHAGAGSVKRAHTSPEQEKEYHSGLQKCLQAGYQVLASGGSALDAVEQAVIALENDPLFNAGKGSVFTSEGTHEMDAAIMCGKTLKAGAVSAVTNVRNPIILARKIMQESESVLLTAKGAMRFADLHGLKFEANTYFDTDHRYEEQLEAKKVEDRRNTDKDTVGAVAVDVFGNVAVATSTGGLTNKKFSRVGDSPIIGGGTYANNDTCAVSCTGDGEFFIRLVSAYDVSCLMEYKGLTLQQACQVVIKDKLSSLGGEGGLIAVDRSGNTELVFNCESMLRGWQNHLEEATTAIWV